MSGDARSLLRAAANERAKVGASGITDRFASYSSTGGLRCSACSFVAIKHESLWGAHVLSKSHRANATRIRDEELRQAEVQRTRDGKRKAEENAAPGHDASRDADASTAEADDAVQGGKRPRTDSTNEASVKSSAFDPEWELFKSQMESTEPEQDASNHTTEVGAALEAEAQLISQGNELGLGEAEFEAADAKSAEDLEAEERARKEQEEREEILSRFEEEQRQQDEADSRVSALKQRLQRIKQARLDKQKAKPNP
ncbi:hypothetical protein EX895_003400 [Sporisorium graminicola]|uniref:Coiled-coil domain-containing protein 16 n=1 Tax=Sporisorium graminicola TaxID=280036 RepID=A0A4V6ETT0_9BASI|nr:hypothetical protein EX895_003400 [Sporisorium graminicola]TKY87819.1 hypothetical protein EX895_003400 [Sporisorium graminicola]